MGESTQPGSCPFHKGTFASPSHHQEKRDDVFRHPHQVDPTTICPGLLRSDFICYHGLRALKQGRVLAFDLRGLSGGELWSTLITSMRAYSYGQFDNIVLTLPEESFLSLRDTHHAVIDFYSALGIALSHISLEASLYDVLQQQGTFRIPFSELVSGSHPYEIISQLMDQPYVRLACDRLSQLPGDTFQAEIQSIYSRNERCKYAPDVFLDYLKIIQIHEGKLVEGFLHTFYMGPVLASDIIRHNPYHTLVLTKASSFSTELLQSQATKRIHDLVSKESERMAHAEELADSHGNPQLFLFGNTVFAMPSGIRMADYMAGPVKTSRPTDSLLPRNSSITQDAKSPKATPIQGGFQIGEDVFLVDQSQFPITKVTYTFQDRKGVCIIRDTPDFYEDMRDSFPSFCVTKAACIYKRVCIDATQKIDECTILLKVTDDIEAGIQ